MDVNFRCFGVSFLKNFTVFFRKTAKHLLRDPDGALFLYTGQWEADEMHGRGELHGSDGVYRGQFLCLGDKNKQHGGGEIIFYVKNVWIY